jgi:hypothetical protein
MIWGPLRSWGLGVEQEQSNVVLCVGQQKQRNILQTSAVLLVLALNLVSKGVPGITNSCLLVNPDCTVSRWFHLPSPCKPVRILIAYRTSLAREG